jgi:hypothetical protein
VFTEYGQIRLFLSGLQFDLVKDLVIEFGLDMHRPATFQGKFIAMSKEVLGYARGGLSTQELLGTTSTSTSTSQASEPERQDLAAVFDGLLSRFEATLQRQQDLVLEESRKEWASSRNTSSPEPLPRVVSPEAEPMAITSRIRASPSARSPTQGLGTSDGIVSSESSRSRRSGSVVSVETSGMESEGESWGESEGEGSSVGSGRSGGGDFGHFGPASSKAPESARIGRQWVYDGSSACRYQALERRKLGPLAPLADRMGCRAGIRGHGGYRVVFCR